MRAGENFTTVVVPTREPNVVPMLFVNEVGIASPYASGLSSTPVSTWNVAPPSNGTEGKEVVVLVVSSRTMLTRFVDVSNITRM